MTACLRVPAVSLGANSLVRAAVGGTSTMRSSLLVGLVATVGLMGGLLAGRASAISCTTTQVVSQGQTMSESALGAGACVLADDKLYGNFNFGNSPTNGTVLFNWNLATGTH